MEKLDAKDYQHLKAAEGWLGLGDVVSASDELEEISPEARAHPAVLFVRYEIDDKVVQKLAIEDDDLKPLTPQVTKLVMG